MQTRSSKTSDVKLSTKNNRKIQNSSSTPRNKRRIGSTSTTPPADPGLRNGKLLSPRRRAIVQTPSRDDVICSQHFDSQIVVGWDCNSPDTLRGIKRISGPDHDDVSDLVMRLIGQEADDEVFTKRNTPPLLGVWKEESEDKLLDNNNPVAQRLRRNRGRHRRKSGKESAVSKDLLSKLSLALDKCSEADEGKKEEQDEGVSELFPLAEDITSKRLNSSDDLFYSESNDDGESKISTKSSNKANIKINIVDLKRNNDVKVENGAKNRSEGELNLKTNQIIECCDKVGDKVETEIDDDNWSDDELFEEDSFIVKATQVSADMKKFVSPVFGMKRKISSDNALPKSKCSRFSFQLSANEEKNKLKNSTAENFTNLQNKHTGNVCANYSKGNMMTVSKPPILSSIITRSDNRKPPIPSSRATFSESKSYTGTKVFSSCAYPVSGNNCANFNKSIPLTRQRTSTSSSYTNTYCNTTSVSKPINQQKPGSFTNLSFKKHNSFSGTGSQNYVSPRRRSVSGDKYCDSVTSVENFYGSCNSNQVNNSIARTYPVVCNTCTASNSSKYNTGRSVSTVSNIGGINNMIRNSISRTYSSVVNTGTTSNSVKSNLTGIKTFVSNGSTFSPQAYNNRGQTFSSVCTTSVASGRSAVPFPGSNLSNKNTSKIEGKWSSIGSFDTSISDDLLCQLAEPDDLLDSQLDVTVTCISKTGTCVPNTKKSDNCLSSDNAVKQYKFKPSQRTSLLAGNIKGPPIKETGSTLHKGPVSNLSKKVPALEQYSEDLFEDDDDMLLADDDGLTEPQILAMLDEVEMLATQQKNNSDHVHLSSGNKPKIINTAVESNVQDSKRQSDKYSTSDYGSDLEGSQGQLTGSQGNLTGSQGHLAGSQGHLTGSQGHLASSPGQQVGSQGQSSSQSKYSPAEIERKKKEAIERRKLKLKKN